jgi:hypothetical protein
VAKINAQVGRYRFKVMGYEVSSTESTYPIAGVSGRNKTPESSVVSGTKTDTDTLRKLPIPHHSGGVQLASIPPHKNAENWRVFESALKPP